MITLKSIIKDYLNESGMNPVKKVINAIFKKNGIKPYKTFSSDVRGFGRSEGSGYKYEQSGLIMFRGLSKKTVRDLANQMEDAGVILDIVRDDSIEFNHRKIKESNQNMYVVWIQDHYTKGKKIKMYVVPKSKAQTTASNLYNRYRDDMDTEVGIMTLDQWNKLPKKEKDLTRETKLNPKPQIKESNQIYFKTASDAIDYARTQAEKKGFQINDDDWFTQITTGGKYSRTRPGVGKTHSFSVGLLKGGKPQRKNLNISLYGMESGKFELTYYIN